MAASSNDLLDNVVEKLAKTNVIDESESDETVLTFAGRGLHLDTEKDAYEVTEAIRNCPKLTSLVLEGNTVGVEAAKAIAKCLESQPTMKRALWKDMFTGRLKSEIPQALMFLSGGLMLAKARLVELDLSDNAFGPLGMDGIAELLKSEVCFELKVLRLNNNGLGISGGKMLAKSLLECHANSSKAGTPLHLSVFVCGRNRLENEGASAIATFFQKVTSLTEVQMPQNGIFHDGIAALSRGLQGNTGLIHLNFNDNIFTEEGANEIAKVLPKFQNLEIINFGDCLVKSGGARILATALRHGHSNLKELHLGFNEINSEAAIEIVESLEKKSYLRMLDLNGNQIGGDGCDLIKGILETYNKPDAIGSFSDDEGENEDDDDYEDVDDDDDDEEEEEEGDEEGNDDGEQDIISGENQKQLRQSLFTPEKVQPIRCSAAEFLATPSAAKLLGLGNNRATLLLAEISKDNGDRDPEKCVNTCFKIASFIKPNGDEEINRAAIQSTDSVLEEAFKRCEADGTLSILSNTFLVYLGLIKSEDKKFRPPTELGGCLFMLDHAIRQPYFARSTKEALQLFLSRFNKAVEQTGAIKHQLMQTLYKY